MGVRLVRRSKYSGNEYAIKVIDKSKLKNKEYMLENEIEILRLCSHPNIVKLREQYESEREVYLIMELATVRCRYQTHALIHTHCLLFTCICIRLTHISIVCCLVN